MIDEYGSMEGIVTLEDLLEEIVGEIEDEFDLPDETVERVDEDTIRIDGTFPIDDFNERFGVEMPRRGLPHRRRLRLRPARPGRRARRRGAHDGVRFQVDSHRGPADRPAYRHVPAVASQRAGPNQPAKSSG